MSNQTMSEKFIFVDPNADLSLLTQYSHLNRIGLSVSSFSSACCILNIAVLAHPTLKDPLYKFLMLISAADLFYLPQIIVGNFIDVECQAKPYLCGSFAHYFTWLYELIAFEYLTSCLAIFSILS